MVEGFSEESSGVSSGGASGGSSRGSSGRLLVTGCAGFIGFFVTKALLEEGYEVVGVDDMNDYYDVKLKFWRLEILSGYRNFRFVKIDISKRDEVFSLRGGRFSCILNLGARAGVRASVVNPKVYVDVNVIGSLNLLDLCVSDGIEKFVLASTSSIYAGCPSPFSEDMNTDRVFSPYAASKKSAELLAHSYHHIYGIDVTVLRYFTVYGPFGRPDMSIFRFVKNTMEGKAIKIFGDGRQRRDFTYIDDIVDGTLRGMKKVGFEIINLGNSRPVEILYVVSLIERELGKKAQIIFERPAVADLPSTYANIDKARRILGWEPRNSIEEGIKKTCVWFMENRDRIRDISTEEKV